MTEHFSRTLTVATPGRGTIEITQHVQRVVDEAGLLTGLCNVFCHHTSASLIICENADPSVHRDLEAFAARLVPDSDENYEHDSEGPDDMPAHIRSILTQPSICVPLEGGRCVLGTWQGIYLWEHRHAPHQRRVTVSLVGR